MGKQQDDRADVAVIAEALIRFGAMTFDEHRQHIEEHPEDKLHHLNLPPGRGNVIDFAVKSRVRDAFGFRSIIRTGIGEAGPDFWNPHTLRGWEMTTPRQWNAHLNRYVRATRPLVRPPINPATAGAQSLWRTLTALIH